MSCDLKFKRSASEHFTSDDRLYFKPLSNGKWKLVFADLEDSEILQKNNILEKDTIYYPYSFSSRKHAYRYARAIFKKFNISLPSSSIETFNVYSLVASGDIYTQLASELFVFKKYLNNTTSLQQAKNNNWIVQYKNPWESSIPFSQRKIIRTAWENNLKNITFDTRAEAAQSLLGLISSAHAKYLSSEK